MMTSQTPKRPSDNGTSNPQVPRQSSTARLILFVITCLLLAAFAGLLTHAIVIVFDWAWDLIG